MLLAPQQGHGLTHGLSPRPFTLYSLGAGKVHGAILNTSMSQCKSDIQGCCNVSRSFCISYILQHCTAPCDGVAVVDDGDGLDEDGGDEVGGAEVGQHHVHRRVQQGLALPHRNQDH